ncbi:hypothetical protein AAF712_002296 [Marasmius tenuissimus]|uniref:Uncharacterized protein n=1 Tax=Marasmius tenuissimus TaxID=585030 RepID=A0ABR3ABU1_9AGAR
MPWPFDTNSEEALEEYCRQMDGLRVLSYKTPLKKRFKGFCLVLSRPPLPTQTTSTLRPVPDLPFGIKTKIELTKGIQTGTQYWNSQVCQLARVESSIVPFVLKFFVPSQAPNPSLLSINSEADFYPEDKARVEVAVLEKLSDFQGSTVPYVFGLHRVEMPRGEEGFALALEYITPGTSLPRMVNDINDKDYTGEFADFDNWKSLV